jgi:hypothetical protein
MMRMNRKRNVLFIIVMFVSAFVCFSQETGGSESKKEKTPQPYEEEEFPRWLKDLRRAEVILVGSIPFTMFIAIEAFDIYRYFSNNMNPLYYPWPIRSPVETDYTIEEKAIIIVTAVSLSLCIAIIDHIIISVSRENKRKKAAAP